MDQSSNPTEVPEDQEHGETVLLRSPFQHSASVYSNNCTSRERLGRTFSYIFSIFVHPDLDSAPLFVGMWERSITVESRRRHSQKHNSRRVRYFFVISRIIILKNHGLRLLMKSRFTRKTSHFTFHGKKLEHSRITLYHPVQEWSGTGQFWQHFRPTMLN